MLCKAIYDAEGKLAATIQRDLDKGLNFQPVIAQLAFSSKFDSHLQQEESGIKVIP